MKFYLVTAWRKPFDLRSGNTDEDFRWLYSSKIRAETAIEKLKNENYVEITMHVMTMEQFDIKIDYLWAKGNVEDLHEWESELNV